MFCPACGANNSTEQRFCRTCGMNLESTAQSLREHFPTGDRRDLVLREQRLEKFGQVAFGGFMIVVALGVLGILYAILDRMVFSGTQPLFGILLMAFLIFAMLTLAYVWFREDLAAKRKRAKAGSVPELQTPAVTGRLIEERDFEPIPSVTEETTNLLPVEPRRK